MKKDNSLFIVVGGASEVGAQFIERCFRKMPNSYFFFTGFFFEISKDILIKKISVVIFGKFRQATFTTKSGAGIVPD